MTLQKVHEKTNKINWLFFFFSCHNAEKLCDYWGRGGLRNWEGRGGGWQGASVSSMDLANIFNDAVIIFSMRRWLRGYC